MTWWRKSTLVINNDACVLITYRRAAPFIGTLDQLSTYMHHKGLDKTACTVVLPVHNCIVKTVELEMHHRYILRRMLRQAIFWQEYCDVELSQCICRWRILPSTHSAHTRVLLLAVPRQTIDNYCTQLHRIGLRPTKFYMQCFDLLAMTRTIEYDRHCIVVIEAQHAYLMAQIDGHYELRELSLAAGLTDLAQDTTDWQRQFQQDEALSFFDQLATTLQQLLAEAKVQLATSDAMSLSVIHPWHQDASEPLLQSVRTLIPSEFQLTALSHHSLIKTKQADTHFGQHVGLHTVVASQWLQNQSYTSLCPNLRPASSITQRPEMRYVQWGAVGLSVVALLIGAMQHYKLSADWHDITLQLRHYDQLSEKLRHRQKQLEQLNTQLRQYAQTFAQVDITRQNQSTRLEFLNFFTSATPQNINIVAVEFNLPALFRIQGYMQSAMAFASYTRRLRERHECADLQIKDLAVVVPQSLKSFVLDCSYQQQVVAQLDAKEQALQ